MIYIYGTEQCPYCVKAKKLASSLGIEFEYKDVTSSKELQAEFKQMFPGKTSVPQIRDGERYVGGYTEFNREFNKQ